MAVNVKTRRDVDPKDTWSLESLYSSDAVWEDEFADARSEPKRVASFKGRLAESDLVLAQALQTWFDANRVAERIWVYAHLHSDEDLGNSHYQSYLARARSAYVELSTAGSYLAPEILEIDDATMRSWLEGDALRPFAFWLEDLLRSKAHTLSTSEERLMSMVSEPLSAMSTIFSVLKNVDLAARLPSIGDEQEQRQQLTHGTFIKLLESRDRGVRKATFDAYYAEYRGNRHTIAATLDGMVKAHIFEARARNFGSTLEAALFDDRVDVAVYDALISAVHDALPAFYRYMALRRRLLGVKAMHFYDAYVPIVPTVELEYTYDQSVDLVCRGMAPLGSEYVDTMRRGLESGWVDRYENVGKRSGAYLSGCYDSMPYVLLNFSGTLDAVFTLAHELGHSMHSHYSNHAQPYHLAEYRILVAEVASTTDEALLNDYLLRTTDEVAVRAYLIDRYLDSFRATLFRQTMFAEFEKLVHAQAEAGQPLTVDSLDASYYDLVKLYFGDEMAFDDEDQPIAWEWARIDHFFYNYYVYKYATGMSSAIAIASGILSDGEPAVSRYLKFLQGGSSNYPLELLRGAGVDLTRPEPVRAALAEFERLVLELESLLT